MPRVKNATRLTGKAKDLIKRLPKEWADAPAVLEIQPGELVLRRTDQMTEWRKLKGAGRSVTTRDIDEAIQAVRTQLQ